MVPWFDLRIVYIEVDFRQLLSESIVRTGVYLGIVFMDSWYSQLFVLN